MGRRVLTSVINFFAGVRQSTFSSRKTSIRVHYILIIEGFLFDFIILVRFFFCRFHVKIVIEICLLVKLVINKKKKAGELIVIQLD